MDDLRKYSLKVFITILIIALVFIMVYIIYNTRNLFLLAFLSFILSLLIRNIAEILIKKFKFNKYVSLVLGIIAVILILFLPFISISVPFISQVQKFSNNMPSIIVGFQSLISKFSLRFPFLAKTINPDTLAQNFYLSIQNIMGSSISYIATASGWVADFFILIVISVFIAINPTEYLEMFLRFIPQKNIENTLATIREIKEVLKSWLVGTLLAIFFVGLLTTIGFWIIGLDFFLVFGIAAGFLEIIPYFGPFLGCLAPAIYALIQAPNKIYPIIIIYIIIQFIENTIFIPMIMKKQIKLPPAITILVILILGKLLGLMGIIVAIPLFASAMLLFEKTYNKKIIKSHNIEEEKNDQ